MGGPRCETGPRVVGEGSVLWFFFASGQEKHLLGNLLGDSVNRARLCIYGVKKRR